MAIIAVDFDGTIVKHAFPSIGDPVEFALHSLRRLRMANNELILHTMRSGEYLEEAVQYLEEAGIQLYGVNENPGQGSWTSSLKPYAHLYIDDAAAGCPLIHPEKDRPYVDWTKVNKILIARGYISAT
jgi:hypothetical protein